MAVTHAYLALHPKKSSELSGRSCAIVMVLSTLLGLCCFVLCVVAEATRSEVAWMATGVEGTENTFECVYKGSGRTPLLCAVFAFLGLAVAVATAHGCLMVIVSRSPPPALMYYDPDFGPAKALSWQLGLLFVSMWVSFAVGEILLLIGLAVESGHLNNWSVPRSSCLVLRQGIFSTAGVFSLITVFLASGLYITALRAQTIMQDEERVRLEVAAVSAALHLTPLPERTVGGSPGENTGFTKGIWNFSLTIGVA